MCQYYNVCTTGPTNPFHGAISFDNIGLAWVAIFLVISLEGWTDVMYFIQVRWLHRMENSMSNMVLLLTLGLTFLLELDILCQLDCGELNLVLKLLLFNSYEINKSYSTPLRLDHSSWSTCVWWLLLHSSQKLRSEKQQRWGQRGGLKSPPCPPFHCPWNQGEYETSLE